jgi:hypothetical protein
MNRSDAERIMDEIAAKQSKQMNYDAIAYRASWMLVGSICVLIVLVLTVILAYAFGS